MMLYITPQTKISKIVERVERSSRVDEIQVCASPQSKENAGNIAGHLREWYGRRKNIPVFVNVY